MVELSKEVRKELRKEAMCWLCTSFSVMSESTTKDDLDYHFHSISGQISMCKKLGIISMESYWRLQDYLLAYCVRCMCELYEKEVA